MGASNSERPLMKDEIELKKMPLSVMSGAQKYKKEGLRNNARMSSKEGEINSPLKTNSLLPLGPRNAAS